jgi:HEAT repeat protein
MTAVCEETHNDRDSPYKAGENPKTNPPCLRRGGTRFLRDGVVSALLFITLSVIFPATAAAQTAQDNWPQTEARLKTLLHGDSEQKRTALAEIRGLRTESASRLAAPALRDSDELVRATAAAAVVFLPPDQAVPALLPLLEDKRPFVRREAAYALGKVGHPNASASLRRKMISDRDLEVRSAAAIALGSIADPAAVIDLLSVLNKRPKEEEEFLRRSAARSVGQIFEKAATGVSATVTPQNFLPPKFKDVDTLKAPSSVIDPTIIDRAVAALSSILRSQKEAADTRREAAFALGATRQPAAATILRPYITDPDPYLAEISKEGVLKIEAR